MKRETEAGWCWTCRGLLPHHSGRAVCGRRVCNGRDHLHCHAHDNHRSVALRLASLACALSLWPCVRVVQLMGDCSLLVLVVVGKHFNDAYFIQTELRKAEGQLLEMDREVMTLTRGASLKKIQTSDQGRPKPKLPPPPVSSS